MTCLRIGAEAAIVLTAAETANAIRHYSPELTVSAIYSANNIGVAAQTNVEK